MKYHMPVKCNANIMVFDLIKLSFHFVSYRPNAFNATYPSKSFTESIKIIFTSVKIENLLILNFYICPVRERSKV